MGIFTENKVFCSNKYKMEMKSKNLFGFFLIIASVLFLTGSISAGEITTDIDVEINGINVEDILYDNPSIVAGETITVKVYFTADENDTDVRVEVEVEGDKVRVDSVSEVFDVEEGQRYRKVLTLQVPYELKDEVSDDVSLNVEIDGKDHKTIESYPLRVQRPAYNVEIMSISTSQSVEAGELMPVDVVLKNVGYNYLDDLYLDVGIPALDLKKTIYVGDLVAEIEEDNDDEDTLRVRVYLRIPYDAVSGIYALEVEVRNSDLTLTAVKQIAVNNDFSNNVVVTEYRKTFSAGEDGVYNLLIVNPTNKVKVYRVVPESTGSLSVRVSESVVAVPAGSSKTVKIFANADSRGEYQFDVNVFSGEDLAGSVRLNANVEGVAAESAIVILTVVLAIIFIVLLVVLVVLLRKKPEKTEEFGESYY